MTDVKGLAGDILEIVEESEEETAESISDHVGASEEYVLWHLHQLQSKGLVERRSSPRGTFWMPS